MHGRNLLRKYLADNGLSQADFSRMSGINTGLVCHYLTDDARKRRTPGLLHAHAIEKVTKGAVPTEAWLDTAGGKRGRRSTGTAHAKRRATAAA